MKYKPFKMKGNPFKRNFGIGESPMKGYKSDAQRKAVHASKAEKSAMSMKHEGPMKAYHTAMKKHDGKTFDDADFMDSHFPSGAPRSAAKMYGKKSPAKMAHGKKSPMKAETFTIKGKKVSRQEYIDHLKSKGREDLAAKHAKKLPKKTYKTRKELREAMAEKSAMKNKHYGKKK